MARFNSYLELPESNVVKIRKSSLVVSKPTEGYLGDFGCILKGQIPQKLLQMCKRQDCSIKHGFGNHVQTRLLVFFVFAVSFDLSNFNLEPEKMGFQLDELFSGYCACLAPC